MTSSWINSAGISSLTRNLARYALFFSSGILCNSQCKMGCTTGLWPATKPWRKLLLSRYTHLKSSLNISNLKRTRAKILLLNPFHLSVSISFSRKQSWHPAKLLYNTHMSWDYHVTYSVLFFTISVLHFRHSSRRFVFQHRKKSKHSLSSLLRHFLTYINGLLKEMINRSRQDEVLKTAD